jgi:hypothetical protein
MPALTASLSATPPATTGGISLEAKQQQTDEIVPLRHSRGRPLGPKNKPKPLRPSMCGSVDVTSTSWVSQHRRDVCVLSASGSVTVHEQFEERARA